MVFKRMLMTKVTNEEVLERSMRDAKKSNEGHHS